MTLSSVMYYTGTDPYTGKRLHVAKNMDDKKQQKLFFFWYLKENKAEIIRLLRKYGRGHLIGKMFRDWGILILDFWFQICFWSWELSTDCWTFGMLNIQFLTATFPLLMSGKVKKKPPQSTEAFFYCLLAFLTFFSSLFSFRDLVGFFFSSLVLIDFSLLIVL